MKEAKLKANASAIPAVQSTLGTAGASCFKSTRSFLTERWKNKSKSIKRIYLFHGHAVWRVGAQGRLLEE
ncbi:hypothetical protein BDW66DRAFT_140419 [Aspergillus desertorum]